VEAKLANIAKVREAMASGSLNVWAADNVVGVTSLELGVGPASLQERLVRTQVEEDRSAREFKDLLIGAFAVALALAAAPLTGGSSFGVVAAGFGAAAGSAALSGALTLEHLQQYQMQSAQSGSDFDKARAISTDDPSLFWLAVDIIGTAIDVGTALHAFTKLMPFARKALSAAPAATAEAMDALAAAAEAEVPGKGLGAAVRQTAERQVEQKAAQARGLTSQWERELNPETVEALEKAHTTDEFRRMDPEVRAVLTRCGSLCVPTHVTPAQEQRLRALLDKIPPRHRNGLQEFLHAHRDGLDAAIGDLEHLFSADLGEAVDAAFDALEEGRLPQEGELVQVGRKGSVPDLARLPKDTVPLVMSLLGQTIEDCDVPVAMAWERARATVLAKYPGEPTRELMLKTLYNETRNEFWKEVRADGAAKKYFLDHGFVFPDRDTSAPLVAGFEQYPGKEREFRLSLDHMKPKATDENWRQALDADNLRFVMFWDNWLLALTERKIPDLAR
jgi:hypothetical protein